MKIDELARPGLLALGIAGIAATALLGFAAGVVVARDPEAARRTARRVAREAARGLEQATLLAAQAREHLGDLWAEAREEALAEVDAADFERSAAGAAKATGAAATAAGAAAAAAAPSAKAPRRRSTVPRKRSTAAKAAPAAADAGEST
jgi:DNA end-binding protein Ku